MPCEVSECAVVDHEARESSGGSVHGVLSLNLNNWKARLRTPRFANACTNGVFAEFDHRTVGAIVREARCFSRFF